MPNFSPDAALADQLDRRWGAGGDLDLAELHLFVTNHAENPADVTATYSAIECTAGGYSLQVITDWAASFVVAHVAITEAGTYTFTFTGAGLPITIYGAFVLSALGVLIYADLIATGGVTISAAGQTYTYRPRVSLENL